MARDYKTVLSSTNMAKNATENAGNVSVNNAAGQDVQSSVAATPSQPTEAPHVAVQPAMFGGEPVRFETAAWGWDRKRDKLDPRPDLKEDTALWERLLRLAEPMLPKEVYEHLYGMRCYGLRIEKGANLRGGYVLKPKFDPRRHTSPWANQEEYEVDRAKWLVPIKEYVRNLLKRL